MTARRLKTVGQKGHFFMNTEEKKKKIEEIINFFEENDDILTECAEELDDISGYLGDDRFLPMEDLCNFFDSSDIFSLLNFDDESEEQQ